MYTGPVLAPIRAINNEYSNGRASMGNVIALTNTVTTVNAAAVGNIVGGVLGGVVGAVVGAVVGPVVNSPNQGRIDGRLTGTEASENSAAAACVRQRLSKRLQPAPEHTKLLKARMARGELL